MPTSDGLTEQVAEVQDALRQVLQESGAAGTGPLTLPPPADITSTQQRSQVRDDDPDSYSNTLTVDLYRDGDGKVWTQPGPGHTQADIHMRVRKWQGKWYVATEHQRVTRKRKIRGHTIVDLETDAMATSGAPVTELGSVERFEQFSPQSAKEAIRQTIAKLQAKGAIYVYDPNAPVPQHTAGLLPNGLLGFAAVAAAAAIAAFAGIGPFASAPASAAQAGAPLAAASAAAAPAVATAASGACGPNGSQNGPEDVTATGAVTAHVTQDCGPGPAGGPPRCYPVQIVPYGTGGQSSYTYDFYGGFFAGGVEYEFHFPGSGIGSTYTVQFPRDPTAPNRGHVTMTSYENFAPASVWQSPDGAPSGSMTWTETTVTMSNVTLTAVPSSPKQAAPVTLNGTWVVHCGGSATGAAVPSAATTTAPVAVAATAAPVAVATTTSSSSGPSPWGPGLAVLAVASAASGLALRSRRGATVTTAAPASSGRDEPKQGTGCSNLEAALSELQVQLAAYMSDPKAAAMAPEIADTRVEITRVEMALAQCRRGTGPDEVPEPLYNGALENAAYRLGTLLRPPSSFGSPVADLTPPTRGVAPSFDPAPPPAPSDDDDPDDPKDKRQEIG